MAGGSRMAARGPLGQQAEEVPSDAGRAAAQLTRVYADAHRLCSMAAW